MALFVGFLSVQAARVTISEWIGTSMTVVGETLVADNGRSVFSLEEILPEHQGPDWQGFHALVEVEPARGAGGSTDHTAERDARDLFAFATAHGNSVVLVENYEGVLAKFDGTVVAE